jgi:hypothetical protein
MQVTIKTKSFDQIDNAPEEERGIQLHLTLSMKLLIVITLTLTVQVAFYGWLLFLL